ncbi:hypothetical protein [Mumia flava]|uniref:hypothetical protein n=1 Tax=Mumia flava TaxID=1348852 RepID=UPI0012FE12B2|nr:hypothetical protein [Mumia flava]
MRPAPRRRAETALRRPLRGGVVAGIAVPVAVLGHVAGGGRPPGWGHALAMAAAAWVLATAASRGRLRLRPVLAVLIGVQGLAHVWCSLLGGPAHVQVLPMVLGHVAATAAAAALLLRGDRALRRLHAVVLAGAVRRIRYAARPVVAIRPGPTHAVVPPTAGISPIAALRGCVSRRGPPVAC